MTEKEIISQIQTLKSIRPDEKWVLATKARILSQVDRGQTPVSWWGVLVVPALMVILIAGIFFYNDILKVPYIEQGSVSISPDPAVLEAITTDLETVESDLVKATANLEKVKTPEKVLDVKEKIDATIENGEKIVSAVKSLVKEPKDEKVSKKVLVATSGVENALEEMKETYFEKQKELARQLIEELKTKSLTKEQKALLSEAENCYNKGSFSEALIKALEVTQINQ